MPEIVNMPDPRVIVPGESVLSPHPISAVNWLTGNPGVFSVKVASVPWNWLSAFAWIAVTELNTGRSSSVTVAAPLTPSLAAWTVSVPVPEVGAVYDPVVVIVPPVPPESTDQVNAGWFASVWPNWSLAEAVKDLDRRVAERHGPA